MSLVLLILQIIISIFLIIVILLQRSENDGFGLGSSGGGNFLSSRGQANLMTKTTGILAAAFMANSLLLAAINSRDSQGSIADEIVAEQEQKSFEVPMDGVETTKNPEKVEELVVPEAAEPITPTVPKAVEVEKVQPNNQENKGD